MGNNTDHNAGNEKRNPHKGNQHIGNTVDNGGNRRCQHGYIVCISDAGLFISLFVKMIIDKTRYRLDEQIRQCILMLENKWTAKEIEFDMDLPRQNYYGSAPLLEQVWTNLIDNAIKHSPEKSSIRILVAETFQTVTVSISDDGEGMTQEVQRHIFEKFYQEDKSHETEGSGLGLALVKRILDLCKGSIQVESLPGKGSTFTVSLPKTPDSFARGSLS